MDSQTVAQVAMAVVSFKSVGVGKRGRAMVILGAGRSARRRVWDDRRGRRRV